MASKSKTLQRDDFNFSLLDTFLGYNSANDKTKLDARFLIRGSKNVYKKLSGTIASRFGLKRRGAADSTLAGVSSSYEWETNLGFKRHLRVVNGKLEVESDIVTIGTYLWYELRLTSSLASLAATLTRFVFSTWWDDDDKTDRLIFVRGDSNMLYWSGAIAKVLSATSNTIVLDPTSGADTWAELGFAVTLAAEKKIVIDGREFTYTGGETTDTLTGVTASSGTVDSLTAGMVAIQSVFLKAGGATQMFPSSFLADFVEVENNQAVVGSYSSRVIYMSANVKASSNSGIHGFLDFENAGAHVVGDPDILILDNNSKGIGRKDGQIVIFAGDSDMYLVTMNKNVNVSFTDQDGQSRFAYNEVTKKKLPGLQAALGHEFIGNFGEYLVWLDQRNQLRALGTFSNSLVQKPVHLSIQVESELSEDDFTGGHLRAIGNAIHITAPNNGRDWMYEVRETVNDNGEVVAEKIWQPPQVRGISRFAIFSGVIHGHSNTNPQVYQVFDTGQYSDDHPSDQQVPYSCVMRLAYRQLAERVGLNSVYERRQGMLTFDKVYIEGYMLEGTELDLKVYHDYQGARAILEDVVSSLNDEQGDMATFFSQDAVGGMGESGFGENPLGDGILEEANDQESVPKFRRIVGLLVKNSFEYSLELSSQEPDARWEVLAIGANVARAAQQPVNLR